MRFHTGLIKQAEEKKVELTSFFQNIVDTMTVDDYYNKYIDWNVKIWKFICLFYCLPKTPLHNELRVRFLEKLSDKINVPIDYEKDLIKKLEKNILSAKYNELTKQEFFKDETWDLMYKAFRQSFAWNEKFIHIWIWYDFIEKWKPKVRKWAYVEIISNLITPIRFAFFENIV